MPKRRLSDGVSGSDAMELDDARERVVDTGERLQVSRADYEKLHHDPYWRTLNNPDKTSSALIINRPDGTVIARQYFPPADEGTGSAPGDDPSPKEVDADDSARPRKTVISAFRPITNIRQVEPFPDVKRYRATTPRGTELVGRRALELSVKDGDEEYKGRLVSFSPVPKGGDIWWGAPCEPDHLVRGDLSGDDLEEAVADAREAGINIKGGAELDVDLPSVSYRKSIKTRRPDQNTVMGDSAKNATEGFFEQFADVLDPAVLKKLKQSIEAPLRGLFASNYRPEWLHGYGFGLTPKRLQPQTEHNLGAAPKWCNTEMMIAEHIGQFLAELADDEGLETVEVKILPIFHMFFDSDIVRHIEYKMKVSLGERTVEIEQQINPFANALFKKKVDVALGTVAISDLLNGKAPDKELKVEIARTGMAAAKESIAVKLKRRAVSSRRREDDDDEFEREVLAETRAEEDKPDSSLRRKRARLSSVDEDDGVELQKKRRKAEKDVRAVAAANPRKRRVIESDSDSDDGEAREVVTRPPAKRRRSARLSRI